MSEPSQCLFCKIVAGEIPATHVFENEHVVGFHDINPQAPVHILMVPRVHFPTLNDLSDGDSDIMGQLVLAAREYAEREGFATDGYRLVMNCNAHGGQTVFHIHMHILAGAPLPTGFGQ